MNCAFFHSTVGKKIIVAVTGLMMIGFLVAHLAGNLQVFQGPEAINGYAKFLKHEAGPLWIARIILLAAITLHFVCTVQLTIRNRQSRPVGYEMQKSVQASRPSKFMIWSGLFLLFYIAFHIMHMTLGFHPNFSHEDVYNNIVFGFQQVPVSVIYLLAMVSLGFHLHHGVSSLFQTLGLTHPMYDKRRKCISLATAWLIPLGYSLIPLAVLAGILTVR